MKIQSKAANKTYFGVEELLLAKSKVFYESMFSTRHIGRVIDYLMFSSRPYIESRKDTALAEYRIRQLLEASIFNAWRNFRKADEFKCVELELGWDKEKLVLALAYFTEADVAEFMPGQNPVTESSIRTQKMLVTLSQLSHGTIVRHSASTGRIQVISVVEDSSAQDQIVSELMEYFPLPTVALKIEADEDAKNEDIDALSDGDVDGFLDSEKKDEQNSIVKRGKVHGKDDGEGKVGEVTDKTGEGDEESFGKVSNKVGEEPKGIGRVINSDLSPEALAEMNALNAKDAQSKKKSPYEGLDRQPGDDVDPSQEVLVVKGSGGKDADDELLKVKRLAAKKQPSKFGLGSGKADEPGVEGNPSEATPDQISEAEIKDKLKEYSEETQASDSSGKTIGSKSDLDVAIASAKSSNDSSDIAEKISSSTDIAEAEENVNLLLNQVKSEVMPLCPGLSEAQFQEAFRNLASKIRESYMQTMHHMLRVKNIQTISKVKTYKDQIALMSAKIDQLKEEKLELEEMLAHAKGDTSASAIASLQEEVESEKTDEDGKPKQSALELKFAKREAEVKAEVAKYKRALEDGDVPEGAKKWAHGFMEAMIKDRALLNEKTKAVEATLKKKEFDFKSAETTLKEQVRIKEETIKQKDFSLEKSKEALTNALSTLEKHRTAASTSGKDSAEMSSKLIAAEKLLATSKESNEKSQERLKEITKKWQDESNSRASVQKELSTTKREVEKLQKQLNDLTGGEAKGKKETELTQQRDRALKAAEDMKRQIRELQAKLAGALADNKKASSSDASKKSGGSGAGDAEWKHKLEHANKLTKSMRDELDKVKKRYDDLKLEETKLRVELGKAQNQLKAAGRAGPQQAAPSSGASAPKPGTPAAGKSKVFGSKK